MKERIEPFTLEEVFEYIDDCDLGKMERHELKSRIVDMLQAEKMKMVHGIVERLEADKEQAHTVERQAIEAVIEMIREEGGMYERI